MIKEINQNYIDNVLIAGITPYFLEKGNFCVVPQRILTSQIAQQVKVLLPGFEKIQNIKLKWKIYKIY